MYDAVIYKEGKRRIDIYPESFTRVANNGLVVDIELYNQVEAFENRLKLLEKEEQAHKNLKKVITQIEKGNIKVFFDKGQGRIYWKDNEITHLFGMYTSIQSEGLWRDSQQAFWQVERPSENKIRTCGKWIHLPLEQVWDIELKNNNTIHWKVFMEVKKPIVIKKEEASVMVGVGYTWWSIGERKKRRFPDKLYSNLWKAVYKGSSDNEVTIENPELKDSFPDIIFKTKAPESMNQIQLRNTSEEFGGRVVGSYLENKGRYKKVPVGKYKYFEGFVRLRSYDG